MRHSERKVRGSSGAVNVLLLHSASRRFFSGARDKLWVHACLRACVRACVSTGVRARRIRVWDADTDQCLRTLRGHTAAIKCLQFDPETNRLYSGARPLRA
jgi:WD40 repeat protein